MGREVTGTPVLIGGKGVPPFRILQPQDDQGVPTPCDKTSVLHIGRKAPRKVHTPRDRRPRGAPPVGTAVTNESFLSAAATDNTLPLDAGRKDSCRSQTSGRIR